ncbi:hypothetical protein KAW50_07885 [candidate division WOR-3 bacterium]|nr:hypothetical protein [candidate division WOR-3 bacterium]
MKNPTNISRKYQEFAKKLNKSLSKKENNQDRIKYLEEYNKKTAKGFNKAYILERLGAFYLLEESSEKKGINCLEKSYKLYTEFYKEFCRKYPYNRLSFPLPQDTLAYRLLNLVKDFIPFLEEKANREKNLWPDYLKGENRKFLFSVLGQIYNDSLTHISGTGRHNWSNFKRVVRNRKIRGFVIENYEACYELFLNLSTEQSIFNANDKYPLARAIIVMYGSTLEGILFDHLKKRSQCLKNKEKESLEEKWGLGTMIRVCFERKFINPQSKLAVLCILILFFRNYIHPAKEIQRKEYFIDINLANIVRIAFDYALIEMIKLKDIKNNKKNLPQKKV